MGLTYPKFTVAAIQAASVFFDRERTIDKAIRLVEQAADKGATLIGFPELFIAGHPGIWYYAKNSNPLTTQRALFTTLVSNAVEVPSPQTERLCATAKKAHAYVVMGICEADTLYSGTIYMSQLFISDGGEIVGVHRKLVTTGIESLLFSRGDGSSLNVFNTKYGNLSALCCGENSHSLIKYAVITMGTQIHIASWPPFPVNLYKKGQSDSIDFRVRQFAHEGKIFVINCCGIIDEQNIVSCCDRKEEREKLIANSGGSSSIIGCNGEYLAGPVYTGEEVLTAEISLDKAIPGKQILNSLGSYGRWDVLSLKFNREKQTPFQETIPPK